MNNLNAINNSNNNEAKWYILNTFSKYENKVKNAIMRLVENNGLNSSIIEVKIPTEETVKEYANGKKKVVEKVLYPGYVFIKMIYNSELGYLINNISGVICFCGPQGRAVPMTEKEIRKMGIEVNVNIDQLKNCKDVVIISGPLKGYKGLIKQLNDKNAVVEVVVFNKSQLVKIDCSQLEAA